MQQELTEIKQQLSQLNANLSRILAPVNEMEVVDLARDVSKGNIASLEEWNKRKKRERKK
jgi:hypothetical protein